ncbi:hypothetical protein VSS74_31090 [Conexibacter stalactiti]|uniref:Secreted protein n=1 Tax=Conexibacter stalactiti TaxID=1940611 RepID=A0ABU4I047_9ACTN|nr:hypothetical protein [Conexibacter stalactiti]MDW5598845.1 hypothetical protein [Conexibacter stalactiti]MEC5039487.1 hypothetical protein [Conexibacter stalactiti]
MTRPFRRLVPLLAVALAAVTFAACGSSSPSSTNAGDSDEETRLAFEDCLRDEGLDVRSDGDGRFAIRATSRPGAGEGMSRTDRAMDSCRRKTGWAPKPPSEAQQQEMRERGLEFAQCMREHGVDMADPAADGRMMLRVEEGESATARRAQEACGELMGGGPGGAAPASPGEPAQ